MAQRRQPLNKRECVNSSVLSVSHWIQSSDKKGRLVQLLLHVAQVQKLQMSTYSISCDVESEQCCCQLSEGTNTHSCSCLSPDKWEPSLLLRWRRNVFTGNIAETASDCLVKRDKICPCPGNTSCGRGVNSTGVVGCLLTCWKTWRLFGECWHSPSFWVLWDLTWLFNPLDWLYFKYS